MFDPHVGLREIGLQACRVNASYPFFWCLYKGHNYGPTDFAAWCLIQRDPMYRLGPFRILGALLAFYGVSMPRNPKNNHSLWRDLGHFAIGTLTCKLVNLLSKLSQEFVWSIQRKPHKNCSTLSKTLFSLRLFKFRTRKTPITLQRLPLQPPTEVEFVRSTDDILCVYDFNKRPKCNFAILHLRNGSQLTKLSVDQ